MVHNAASDATCVEVVSAFLERVAKTEPNLHSFRQINAEVLYREAAALDALPADQRGPLHGELVAIKEVLDVAGYTCGWGTEIHASRQPKRDSFAVQILRSAGAIIAGITVSTEYAMSAVGPTVNPFDPTRSPGASSQGSAAAVGSGLVDMSLGSQTIGSIIRPASYCGCIGFKPTWGAIDVRGCMPLSTLLDHVGFFAADPDRALALLKLLAPDLSLSQTGPKKVTVLAPWYDAPTSPEMTAAVDAAIAVLANQGMDIQSKSMPGWIVDTEVEILDTILAYGMAQYHGDDFDTHADHMTGRIKDYILRGRDIDLGMYEKALAKREDMIDELQTSLDGGVAIMPSASGVATLSVDGTGPRDPQRLWTLVGFPAASIPTATSNGLPLGIQAIALPSRDHDIIKIARALLTSTYDIFPASTQVS